MAEKKSSESNTYVKDNQKIDKEWKYNPSGFTLNEKCLRQEMSDILEMLACYMQDIEMSAKSRRVKRINNITGDYEQFCKGEKRFLRRLDYGKCIMQTITDSLKVIPNSSSGRVPASELYSRIGRFVEDASGSTSENIQEMSFYLAELMVRFARICDTEGVKHNLPIDAYPAQTNVQGSSKKNNSKQKVLFKQELTEKVGKSTSSGTSSRSTIQSISKSDTGTDPVDLNLNNKV